MIILKNNVEIGQIDEKEKKIITYSYPLRNFVQTYIDEGIWIGLKGWYDKKLKAYKDTAKQLFPKDGKKFWLALQEELILEGYGMK